MVKAGMLSGIHLYQVKSTEAAHILAEKGVKGRIRLLLDCVSQDGKTGLIYLDLLLSVGVCTLEGTYTNCNDCVVFDSFLLE